MASHLTPADRSRLQLKCAAILVALAVASERPEEELLEPTEAARRMKVGRTTVYEMLRNGSLRFVQKGKRGKLIPESEIENWKTKNLREGVGLRDESLDARVAATDLRTTIANNKKTPTPFREGGLDRRPHRNFR